MAEPETIKMASSNLVIDIINVVGTWALFVGALIAIRREGSSTTRTINAQVEIARQAVEAQAQTTSRSLSADVFARLNDKWDSTAMRRRRRALCRKLRALKRDLPDDSLITDVIDYFEDLGFLVRKNWIDREAAWHSFAEYARMYWYAIGREYAESVRERYEGDSTYYTEYQFLVEELERIELEKRSLQSGDDIAISPDSIDDFIAAECELEASNS